MPWIKKMNLADFLDLVLIYQEDQHSHLTDPNQICHIYFFKNVDISFLHPSQNFLADLLLLIMFAFFRFCTKHSKLTKTASRSDWFHLFISLIVEYEIANNVIQAHWIPAFSPNKAFPWFSKNKSRTYECISIMWLSSHYVRYSE